MVKSMVWWVCGGASGGKVSLKVAATDKHGILPGRSSPCHFYLIISEKVKVKVFIYNVSESESCDRQAWIPPGTIIISRKVKIKDKHGLLPSGGNGQIVWSSLSVMMMGLSCPLFDGSLRCCLLSFILPHDGSPASDRLTCCCREGSFEDPPQLQIDLPPLRVERDPSTQSGDKSSHKGWRNPLQQVSGMPYLLVSVQSMLGQSLNYRCFQTIDSHAFRLAS